MIKSNAEKGQHNGGKRTEGTIKQMPDASAAGVEYDGQRRTAKGSGCTL